MNKFEARADIQGLSTDKRFLFSGIVNVLMTTPLWVVNTRLKLQGAMFRTKGLENNKTKKYKGIIGECIITRDKKAKTFLLRVHNKLCMLIVPLKDKHARQVYVK